MLKLENTKRISQYQSYWCPRSFHCHNIIRDTGFGVWDQPISFTASCPSYNPEHKHRMIPGDSMDHVRYTGPYHPWRKIFTVRTYIPRPFHSPDCSQSQPSTHILISAAEGVSALNVAIVCQFSPLYIYMVVMFSSTCSGETRNFYLWS